MRVVWETHPLGVPIQAFLGALGDGAQDGYFGEQATELEFAGGGRPTFRSRNPFLVVPGRAGKGLCGRSEIAGAGFGKQLVTTAGEPCKQDALIANVHCA